jgi:hypothetical protein
LESRTKAAFEIRKLPSTQPDRPGILASTTGHATGTIAS